MMKECIICGEMFEALGKGSGSRKTCGNRCSKDNKTATSRRKSARISLQRKAERGAKECVICGGAIKSPRASKVCGDARCVRAYRIGWARTDRAEHPERYKEYGRTARAKHQERLKIYARRRYRERSELTLFLELQKIQGR